MSEIQKQITLYKNVFALDKTLKSFTKFSEKRQQFTLDKVIDNLKYLIEGWQIRGWQLFQSPKISFKTILPCVNQ